MEPVTKSSNSDTFDLFVKCLLYVVLFPSILGLLFSKYLNRLIQKAQINSKYGINVSAFNKFAICIAILLEAIILAGFSYCMYAVFQTHIV
jgi:flagellar biosynthesis protein FlhB